MIGVVVLLPLVIGIVTGIPAGFLLNKAKDKNAALLVLSMFILLTSAVGSVSYTHLPPSGRGVLLHHQPARGI